LFLPLLAVSYVLSWVTLPVLWLVFALLWLLGITRVVSETMEVERQVLRPQREYQQSYAAGQLVDHTGLLHQVCDQVQVAWVHET